MGIPPGSLGVRPLILTPLEWHLGLAETLIYDHIVLPSMHVKYEVLLRKAISRQMGAVPRPKKVLSRIFIRTHWYSKVLIATCETCIRSPKMLIMCEAKGAVRWGPRLNP